jgi:hypothetical protein
MLVVTASSIGEELFYRAAIQVCAASSVLLTVIKFYILATVWRKGHMLFTSFTHIVEVKITEL